jgi:succinoglycan biosynthesis transport protein ExoP
LDELKSEVEQAQEQMMELQRKMGTLGYDSTHNQLQASLEDLLGAEGAAKIARITAESRYRMVAGWTEYDRRLDRDDARDRCPAS